jgi:phosphopentomutase
VKGILRPATLRRIVVLVLDGFGVGAMPDVGTEDAGANTLRSVDGAAGPLVLPTLARLGLGNLAAVAGIPPNPAPQAAYGRCALAHPGADTYLGHQEVMGDGVEHVELHLLSDLQNQVTEALVAAGHSVQPLLPGRSPLVVDGCVLVADNIEARPRLNINVTGSLDDVDFDHLTRIGQVVRRVVPVPRVIVVASRGFGLDQIRAHVKERTPGQIGVDSPALGVYNEHYQVRHLGVEFDADQQVPTRTLKAGHQVVLLGKAADVVRCPGAEAENLVVTTDVMAATQAALGTMASGLVVANVQETDLAGHEQDPRRYAEVLATVDTLLPAVLEMLRDDDVLFITGDHGNDPTVGTSRHTREYTPVLAAGPRVQAVSLGTRATLADIGATAAELLDVGPTGGGNSFAEEIACSWR